MLDSLLPRILALPGDRVIVGIAGPPGAGKTTLAAALAPSLDSAAVVPMDGFHLANDELDRLGLSRRKGAPETFDSLGYVALLRRLRSASELVYAPSFDHVMNEPIAGSIPVPPSVRVVVTEGNYLLLWPAARALLDLSIYIDVAVSEERVAGLIERQIAKGLTPSDAAEWVHRSDESNARLIATTASLADVSLTR